MLNGIGPASGESELDRRAYPASLAVKALPQTLHAMTPARHAPTATRMVTYRLRLTWQRQDANTYFEVAGVRSAREPGRPSWSPTSSSSPRPRPRSGSRANARPCPRLDKRSAYSSRAHADRHG